MVSAMKKCFPVSLLFSLALPLLLAGCGGGSGRSGDDGTSSLSGRVMTLEEGGPMAYRLLFSGQDVEVYRVEGRVRYQGIYTYRLQGGDGTAVLDIRPATDGTKACSMSDVLITFEDARREEGVITSGTCTETAPGLDESIMGIPRSMAGWTCHVDPE